MNSEVMFFGSLARKGGGSGNQSRTFAFQQPTPLIHLLEEMDLKPREVQMAMVNHRAVTPDYLVQPGDRIALFPKEYPLFADWLTFRQKG